MANVKQINVNGTAYDIKDATARASIDDIVEELAGKVTNVAWDATNKKITKTINGTTTDVVTLAQLITAGVAVVDGDNTFSEDNAFSGTITVPTPTANNQAANKSYVDSAVAAVETGAVHFKGTLNSQEELEHMTNYKAGWYWLIGTAGTYVGETCEVGDMIFATAERASYNVNDFTVIQANINLGDYYTKTEANAAFHPKTTVDSTPTSGSSNLVTSGGVYTAINRVISNDKITDVEIISVSLDTAVYPLGSNVSLDASVGTAIVSAYTNKKLPVLSVSHATLTKSIYIPIFYNGSYYGGSGTTTYNNKPIALYVWGAANSLTFSTTLAPYTSSTTSALASYSNEVITFTSGNFVKTVS